MEDILDLWGNIENDSGLTSDILPLIQKQANLLQVKTGDKLKADFSKITYQYKEAPLSILQTVSSLTRIMAPVMETKAEIVENDERKNLEDASHLYEHAKYKFEIYNDKYKFRLFTLDYQSTYPIELEVEYGILDDKLVKKEINSYEQMKDILSSIFTSNKVRFIIHRMIKLDKD